MHFYFIILVSALQSSCIYTMNNSNFFIEWEHNSSEMLERSNNIKKRSEIIKNHLHNNTSPETLFNNRLIRTYSSIKCSPEDFQLLCKFGLSNEKKEIMALQSVIEQNIKILDVCFQEGVDPEKIALKPISNELVEEVSPKTITNHLEYMVCLESLNTLEVFFKHASTTLKTRFILFCLDQLYADRINFLLQISSDKNSLIQACEIHYNKDWNTIINDNASYSLSAFEKDSWESLKQYKENILWQKLRNLFE